MSTSHARTRMTRRQFVSAAGVATLVAGAFLATRGLASESASANADAAAASNDAAA